MGVYMCWVGVCGLCVCVYVGVFMCVCVCMCIQVCVCLCVCVSHVGDKMGVCDPVGESVVLE